MDANLHITKRAPIVGMSPNVFFLLTQPFLQEFWDTDLNMPTPIIAALQMKVLDYAKRMVGLARFWWV